MAARRPVMMPGNTTKNFVAKMEMKTEMVPLVVPRVRHSENQQYVRYSQTFFYILYTNKLNTPFFARGSSIRYTFGALEWLLSFVIPFNESKVAWCPLKLLEVT